MHAIKIVIINVYEDKILKTILQFIIDVVSLLKTIF